MRLRASRGEGPRRVAAMTASLCCPGAQADLSDPQSLHPADARLLGLAGLLGPSRGFNKKIPQLQPGLFGVTGKPRLTSVYPQGCKLCRGRNPCSVASFRGRHHRHLGVSCGASWGHVSCRDVSWGRCPGGICPGGASWGDVSWGGVLGGRVLRRASWGDVAGSQDLVLRVLSSAPAGGALTWRQRRKHPGWGFRKSGRQQRRQDRKGHTRGCEWRVLEVSQRNCPATRPCHAWHSSEGKQAARSGDSCTSCSLRRPNTPAERRSHPQGASLGPGVRTPHSQCRAGSVPGRGTISHATARLGTAK